MRHFSYSCCWVIFIYLYGVSFGTSFPYFLEPRMFDSTCPFHRMGTSWVLLLPAWLDSDSVSVSNWYFQCSSVKVPVSLKKRKLFSFQAFRSSSLPDGTKALSLLWLGVEASVLNSACFHFHLNWRRVKTYYNRFISWEWGWDLFWRTEMLKTCVFSSAEYGTYMLDFLSSFDWVLNGAASGVLLGIAM